MTQDSSTARLSIAGRLGAHLPLKLTMAVVLNLWALAPFFLLQHNLFFPVRTLPETILDALVPFDDRAVWLYLSLLLLIPVAPMQMVRREELFRYSFGVVAMSLTANLVFFFWPTAFPRPSSEEPDALYHWLISWVTPLNDFPSLHAAMTVFSALCCEFPLQSVRQRWPWRTGLWFWVLGILYATLATKEHLAVDVLGGILLGLGVYPAAFGRLPMLFAGPWVSSIRRVTLSRRLNNGFKIPWKER